MLRLHDEYLNNNSSGLAITASQFHQYINVPFVDQISTQSYSTWYTPQCLIITCYMKNFSWYLRNKLQWELKIQIIMKITMYKYSYDYKYIFFIVTSQMINTFKQLLQYNTTNYKVELIIIFNYEYLKHASYVLATTSRQCHQYINVPFVDQITIFVIIVCYTYYISYLRVLLNHT